MTKARIVNMKRNICATCTRHTRSVYASKHSANLVFTMISKTCGRLL